MDKDAYLAEAIIKRLVREKKAQPEQRWHKHNWKKIMVAAITDEIQRVREETDPAEDRIEAIYNAYPRKTGKQRAIKAIKNALKLKDHAYLLERTETYAKAVARWSHEYRYRGSAGSDIVPHPASWFNAGQYDDDEHEWKGDPSYGVAPDVAASRTVPPEPEGWQDKVVARYGPNWTKVDVGVKKDGSDRIYKWEDLGKYEGFWKELAR